MKKAEPKPFPYFFVFFLPLFFFFTWPLWTFREGLVRGDYQLQIYPWLHYYADFLKQGKIPLWTDLIQCGFPLFAEGQTAMLYWPSLIFFRWLPFIPAYNLFFLAHFFSGAFFMYLFCRKNSVSREGSTLATLAYSFGSLAAGGFYGIFSLRPMIWFPLCLLLVQSFLKTGKRSRIFALALVLGQVWLAGNPQLAAYATAFIVLFYILNARGQRAAIHGWFASALLGAALIALPQIWATMEMGLHSTRKLYGSELAGWSPMPPWALMSSFVYAWEGFFRCHFYFGAAPFLLILAAVSFEDRQQRLWAFWALSIIGLLFITPLWWMFTWILGHLPFTELLRDPSKLLYFAGFFICVLAGRSFDRVIEALKADNRALIGQIEQRAGACLTICTAIILAALALIFLGGGMLTSIGEWWVRTHVIRQNIYHKPLEQYLKDVTLILGILRRNSVLVLPFFVETAAVSGAWFFIAKKGRSRFFVFTILFLLSLDLLFYGMLPGKSFIGNIGPFVEASPQAGLPKDGRWLDVSAKDPIYKPNQNMTTGHAVPGLYSPLADKNYFLATKELRIVDDSVVQMPPIEADAFNAGLSAERELVNFLGVKYLLADFPLRGYKFSGELSGHSVYVNDAAEGEFTFSDSSAGARWEVKRSGDLLREIDLSAEKSGYLVRHIVYDRGWSASVDGRSAPVERAGPGGAFQEILIPPGRHAVMWAFSPAYFRGGLIASLAASLILLSGALLTGLVYEK